MNHLISGTSGQTWLEFGPEYEDDLYGHSTPPKRMPRAEASRTTWPTSTGDRSHGRIERQECRLESVTADRIHSVTQLESEETITARDHPEGTFVAWLKWWNSSRIVPDEDAVRLI